MVCRMIARALMLVIYLSNYINTSQQTNFDGGCTENYLNTIVIDAGSTGTRLHETRFKIQNKLITIEKTQSYKVSPGLSAFEKNPAAAGAQVFNLLNRAKQDVDPASWKCTGVAVRATAGLRQLSKLHQERISREVEKVILNSGFKHNVLKKPFEIMVGEEEGYLSWLGTNILLQTYNTTSDVGIVEMGGGSSQLAYRTTNSNKVKTTSYPIGAQNGKLKMLGNFSNETICMHPETSVLIEYGARKVVVSGKKRNGKLINPLNIYENCYRIAKSVVIKGARNKTLHVDKKLRKNFFALSSSFYYAALNAHLFNENDVDKNITVGRLINAAKKICAQPPKSGQFKIFLCMDLVLQYALVKDGFGFDDEDVLIFALKIRNIEIGWPVGLAAKMVVTAISRNSS